MKAVSRSAWESRNIADEAKTRDSTGLLEDDKPRPVSCYEVI